MASLEDQIREIRTAISAVQGRKVRAAVELENAQDRLRTAKDTLKTEFGVSTTAEAREMLDRLQNELNEALVAVEVALSEAGA